MSAINRSNSAISNQTLATNKVLLYILVAVGIAAALVVSYSVITTKTAFNPLQPSIQTSDTTADKAQTIPQSTTLTVVTATPSLPLPTQKRDTVAELQPAPNYIQSSQVGAETLQPNANSIQLTGVDLQNAKAILQ